MKYATILFFILISCNPERKLNKLQINHPELVADKMHKWYPITTKEIITDSTEVINYKPIIDSINKVIFYERDTIKIILKDKTDCASLIYSIKKYDNLIQTLQSVINRPAPIVYKTKVVVDSASNYMLQNYTNKLLEEKDKLYKRNSNLYLALIGLLILLCIIIIFKK